MQMQRVVQHIDDGHVTAEDCRLLGLDSKVSVSYTHTHTQTNPQSFSRGIEHGVLRQYFVLRVLKTSFINFPVNPENCLEWIFSGNKH